METRATGGMNPLQKEEMIRERSSGKKSCKRDTEIVIGAGANNILKTPHIAYTRIF
jgi:hypothetical protein